MDQAQREHLAQQIRQAFAQTPYPKGGFNSEEWAQLCPCKPWESVSFETLSHNWGYFYDYALTISELRYLLPPLLIGIVLESDKNDMLWAATIWRLTPYKNYENRFYEGVLKAMTHKECVVVSAFLNAFMEIIRFEYFSGDEPCLLKAIEFWQKIALLPSNKFKGMTIKGGK